jgi:hypothetical protein
LLADAVSDPDVGAQSGIAVTVASSLNGVWQFSLNGGGSWTGMGNPSGSAALLLPDSARVRFLPAANFNGQAKLWYRAWDQTGTGTAGGTLNTSGNTGGVKSLSTASEIATLTVSPVNDAPVLQTAPTPSLGSTREDATAPAGRQVSTLLSGAVSDVDQNARQGIAVVGAAASNGLWQFQRPGQSAWTSMGVVSESAALLLPAGAKVRFIPKANFNGTVYFYYRAWDQTEGQVGDKLNLSGRTGGTAAFSAARESASLIVTAVNDKPVLSFSGSIGYVRNKPAIALAAFAKVSDVDSADFAGGRLRVRITVGTGASNRLGIGAGFTMDGSKNVLQGSTVVGRLVSNGFGTNELVVALHTSASKAVVQQLVRAITFKTVGGSVGQRKVVFTVSDGDGGLSTEATKTVNVT